MKRILMVVLLAVGLVGCASTGTKVVTPENFGETMVYGYTTNAFARRSAAGALNAGLISKENAQHVLTTTNTTRTALDEARKAGCPDYIGEPKDGDKPACLSGLPETVMGKLRFAVGLADQAVSFLKSMGAIKQ